MRTQLLIFSFCISSTFCSKATTYLSKSTNWTQVDNEFSDFYLKNGSAINFNMQTGDVYFPKCCPPNYQYEPGHHKCVKVYNSSPIYDYLNLEVNLIGNQLKTCEVIVDHVLSESELVQQVSYSQTTLILRGKDYFELGQYCLDRDFSERIALRLCYSKDYCVRPEIGHKRCIKKCCPDGYHYYMTKCQLNPTLGINISDHEDVIRNIYDEFVLWNDKQQCSKYLADKSKFKYYIEENGSFFIREMNEMKEYKIDEKMYCVEERITPNRSELVFLLCGISNKYRTDFLINRVTMIISSVFLALTIILLLVRSRSCSLMDEVVISYCFVLAATYIMLSLIQFGVTIGSCTFMGYALYFLFTAMFTWINVLAFDIWKSFGIRGYPKYRFLKYNLYAWSIPTLLTGFVLFFNYVVPLPDYVHPIIGRTQCILENRLQSDRYGYLIFFLLPTSISVILNTYFFVICLRIIFKRAKDVNNLKRKDNQISRTSKALAIDRQRVLNGVALFLIMGISWSFEIISSIISFKTNKGLRMIEIIIDTFNSLQGLIIFLVIHYGLILRIINRCFCKNTTNEEEYSLQQEVSVDEKKEMIQHKTDDETTQH